MWKVKVNLDEIGVSPSWPLGTGQLWADEVFALGRSILKEGLITPLVVLVNSSEVLNAVHALPAIDKDGKPTTYMIYSGRKRLAALRSAAVACEQMMKNKKDRSLVIKYQQKLGSIQSVDAYVIASLDDYTKMLETRYVSG